MKVLLGLVALGVIVLALSVSPQLQERLENSNAYQRERQALDLAQRQDALERQRQWEAAVAPGNVALFYASGAGALVCFALLLNFLHTASARREREHNLVNVQGYPLARQALERGDGFLLELIERSLLADKTARIEEARKPNVPLHFTYAPKISGQAPDLLDEPEVALTNVPTFADLLGRGDIGPGRPLVLGVGAGGIVSGGFRDLYSTLVAGQSGTGKSTTQRFFASQAALHDARFIVVDPHSDAGEDSLAATLAPLESRYLCDVADDERAILEAVRLASDIGQKRLHGQDADRRPILVWVDEATGLLGHSKIGPQLAELLETVAQQFRKVGIYCSVSAQIVTASRTGGESALRDSMASVICHKMRRSQARLILPLDDAATVERLEPGRAIFWRTSGASELIAVPNTTSADCAEVARRLLTGSAPAMERLHERAVGSHSVATMEPVRSHIGAGSSAVERGDALSAQSARVLALFREGQDIASIVRTLYGVTSASGSQYQRKSAEVQGLLRAALQ